MTKIAIISQAEQGVLIDISGCASLSEAKQYLTSTLQVSSQFWEGLVVDLNLGPLVLTPGEVNEIQAIVSDVGVQPRQIFSLSPITRSSLIQCRLPLGGLGQLQCYVPMRPQDLESPPLEAAGAEQVLTRLAESVPEPTLDTAIIPDGIMPSLDLDSVSGCRTEASCESFIALPNDQSESSFDFLFSQAEPVRTSFSMPNHHIAQRQAAVSPPAGLPVSGAARLPALSKSIAKPATKPASSGVLIMKQTLRSGQRVCHNGHLVVIGDVNPGAELVADGDITVWGALRGMAHAGASGDLNAEIRALKFGSIQLRIGQAIARSPDRNKTGVVVSAGPETARVVDGKIRLSVSDPD
jgi:septum formation inhibitor MinC